MGGALDLNFSSVIDIMNLLEIKKEEQLFVLKNVQHCWRYFNDKNEKEAEKQNIQQSKHVVSSNVEKPKNLKRKK